MMTIQIDSREQKNDHVTAYFEAVGVKYITSKMYVGDYQNLTDASICIDKKYGLQEVYSCLTSGYNRFAAECKRAKDAGIKLIVLIEENDITDVFQVESWKNPRIEKWNRINAQHKIGKALDVKIASEPPISSKRLQDRMTTLSKRTGVKWQFCRKEDTGKTILQILGYEDKLC